VNAACPAKPDAAVCHLYWQEVRMILFYMGTGELEAKADRFNLNA
jgi:hypothetical protein